MPPIAGVMIVIVMQTIAFLGLWDLMVMIARSQGRFRRELFFGITIYYGKIWFVGLFITCSLVAFLTTKPTTRWWVIFSGLSAWLFLLWPSFSSRPIAMPSFFGLGATILIVGSGFGVPYFRRTATKKPRED